MRPSRQFFVYAGFAVVAAALLAYAFWPEPALVEIAEVVRGRLEVTVNDDGKTRIKERYVVLAPLMGDLLRVELHAGDPVQAGATIVAAIQPSDPSLLDARALAEAEARVRAAEARREHARALLERAQANSKYAMTQHERTERLLASGTATREQYDLAVTMLRTATNDVQAGEFAVQIAAYELEMAQAALTRTRGDGAGGQSRLDLHSPIDGEVLHVFRESEGMIAPGTPLMELGDPRDLEIEIDVLSTDAVRISPDAKVYLEHWGAQRRLLARVRLIEPQAFLKVSALGVEEQRVNVIADFVDPPETRARLGDAYRVEAQIVVWEGDDLLLLNAGALFRYEGGWAVYRIAGGRAALTPVEVGQTNGRETQIVKGLKEGDRVVAYPSDQIRDGVRVERRVLQR
ncbi:MAG: HlyD family efflux transporter periplasmic adaptor subunit [Pirellulales bacterium]|nr:HlyD family efflux transporter periplasmic adaptor subunit [Pirellulales bacterium]